MSLEEKDDILRDIHSEVQQIRRGLYGDEINKQPGLMQKHYELAGEVKTLKEKDQRRTWIIAGFSSATSLSFPFIWDWIKKHAGL